MWHAWGKEIYFVFGIIESIINYMIEYGLCVFI